jgi:rubredoxin
LSEPFQKWQCFFCGYTYDEFAGSPDEGIPAGTRWADIPDDWVCPGCGASKTDFAMMEVA